MRCAGGAFGSAAPELLAVLRFLRDSPGSESLGISYGAAYLKAAPPRAGRRSLRCHCANGRAPCRSGLGQPRPSRDRSSPGRRGSSSAFACAISNATVGCESATTVNCSIAFSRSPARAEERAHAVLGLTRPDCIDPDMGPMPRAALDDERAELLEQVSDGDLNAMMRSRLHARRAGVWALAYDRAPRRPRRRPAERALAELLAVHLDDLGDDRRAEYVDAVLRVSAIRWAGGLPVPPSGALGQRGARGSGSDVYCLLDAQAACRSTSSSAVPTGW